MYLEAVEVSRVAQVALIVGAVDENARVSVGKATAYGQGLMLRV